MVAQSTWLRFHHIDLARELHKLGHLQRIFTSLPWWKARTESNEQGIPRDKIWCNFLLQGARRVGRKLPGYSQDIDFGLGTLEGKLFSRWVARNLPQCDAFIGISGSGLHAGRLAKGRGTGYVFDRGSTQIRHANTILGDEYRRWSVEWTAIHPWLIENEEAEAEEANLITVPSQFVRSTFIEQGSDANKIRVVPYGVSLDEFYPDGRPPTDGRFRMVFVGQFSIRKGAPYLLQAFRQFRHPKKELIVVGAVPDPGRRLIESLCPSGVQFVGPVRRSEVRKYMSTAHVLVLPSIEEGLALVQAQAMACGCPIIATPNTGSESLFTHQREGLIVEAQNADALTAAMTQLAETPRQLEAMSAACLERIKDIGGWEQYGRRMLAAAMEAKSLAAVGHTAS